MTVLHISHGADPDDWFVVKPIVAKAPAGLQKEWRNMMTNNTEGNRDVLRVTAVYEYELPTDLGKRQKYYGTTDPAECARIDAGQGDTLLLGLDASELKSLVVEPVQR